MPKFRKKPITVEANQLTGEMSIADAKQIGACFDRHPGLVTVLHVHTKQGQVVAVSPGEWIIRETDGSGFYPCDPEMFDATYELEPVFPKYV